MLMFKQFLDKCAWDKNVFPYDYTLEYYDRVKDANVAIGYHLILNYNSFSALVYDVENDINISVPLHRFRKVTDNKTKEVLWQRQK